jgi:hypothetical protein
MELLAETIYLLALQRPPEWKNKPRREAWKRGLRRTEMSSREGSDRQGSGRIELKSVYGEMVGMLEPHFDHSGCLGNVLIRR